MVDDVKGKDWEYKRLPSSSYGQHNPAEDFAEMLTLRVYDPEAYKKRHSATTTYLKFLIDDLKPLADPGTSTYKRVESLEKTLQIHEERLKYIEEVVEALKKGRLK